MSDIVERLRHRAKSRATGTHCNLLLDAADEIQRLSSELANARNAAEKAAKEIERVPSWNYDQAGEIEGLRSEVENYHKYSVDYMAERNGRLAAEAELANAREENKRLDEALRDLLSWFSENPSEPVWLLRAGDMGADDAIKAARAALKAEGESR